MPTAYALPGRLLDPSQAQTSPSTWGPPPKTACSPSRRRGSSSPCWRSHPTRPEPAGRAVQHRGCFVLGTMTLDPRRALETGRWAAGVKACPWGGWPHTQAPSRRATSAQDALPSESGEGVSGSTMCLAHAGTAPDSHGAATREAQWGHTSHPWREPG